MTDRAPSVFLIDDDDDEHYLFAGALKEMDPEIKCTYASDGMEALAMVRTWSSELPDVIFLDLNMPRMNGIQLLAALKDIERFKPVPVIIYTTSEDRSEKKITEELGAAGYLIKPAYSHLKTEIGRIFEHLGTTWN